MKKNKLVFLSVLLLGFLYSCKSKAPVSDVVNLSWQQIEQQAKGATIVLNMYQGDKRANRYMSDFVVPALQQRYGITMEIVGGQGKEIVNNVMTEKEAGKTPGTISFTSSGGAP